MKGVDSYFISIAGALIAGMAGLITWAGKKWMGNFEATTNKILSKLEDIINQINDLKTENMMQTQHMREIESRVEVRLQGIEKRLDAKREKLGEHEHRISQLEKVQEKINIFHNRNHPNDKL